MDQPANNPASQLAARILRAAQTAQSEEDLRIAVETALGKALSELGIESSPQYEKTILRGSADAVYGHAIIEYERPGKLSRDAGRTETIRQVIGYLVGQTMGLGDRQPEALNKMIGICLDGRQIMFVRYTQTQRGMQYEFPGLPAGQLSLVQEQGVPGKFQVLGPYPVDQDSINVFLLFLRALARKPLTPEALAREFGPTGEVAGELVRALHSALLRNQTRPQVATFLIEWQRLFGIVYGENLGQAGPHTDDLEKLYGIQRVPDLRLLLFTVHTYFALLMKFLAIELLSLQGGMLVTSFASDLPARSPSQIKERLSGLEDGGLFNALGIVNFLEGDFFRWYLDAWDDALAAAISRFALALSGFEPSTSTLEPDSTRDLLKKLYQYLIPKSLRHDLGEYYTPDWLAERLLNQVGYDGNPDSRLIDPACGSGTFLVLALQRLRQRGGEKLLSGKLIAEAALKNVVGFDLNPLAVIAARTNYLLALGDLIRHTRPIEIPVYMCDSVLTPTEASGQLELFAGGYTLHTTAGDFPIPGETVHNREVDKLAKLLEDAVQGGYTAADFLAVASRSLTMTASSTSQVLRTLYDQLAKLHKEHRNRIWARLIKNAFAPIFMGHFDFVTGNPPWISWESLSQPYRDATARLWADYGLFTLKGHAARLGGGKKDLSMLFTYVAADRYLKPGGKLGFVITQTVFQTKGAGAGFRRFRLGDGDALGVIAVDDMVDLQPFEGASNWTAVVVLRRGSETRYPVPYTVWKRRSRGRVALNWSLEEVMAKTTRSNLSATPVHLADITSPWMVGRAKDTTAISKAKGASAYTARAGVCTWADGVYWLRILEKRPDGLLVVENLATAGKREIPTVRAEIEPDLLFPFVPWDQITRFHVTPSHYILMVQDPDRRVGYDEAWMRANYPCTYRYFHAFRDILLKRSGYLKYFDKSDPFYTMYNVNVDTFAGYRVVWKAMGTRIEPAVVELVNDQYLGYRPPVHKNTSSAIPFNDPTPAHYVCALLSSSVVTALARSFSVKGGKGFGSTSLLETVAIPAFDPSSALHCRLAELSIQAHAAATSSGPAATPSPLTSFDMEIDRAASDLWGITHAELATIQKGILEAG